MQKTWDANNRGGALRALLVSLAAVSIYLLILQLGLSASAPVFCDSFVPSGLYQADAKPDAAGEPAEKPAEEQADSINNAASIDFLCPADLRSLLSQMHEYERNENWAEAMKIYQQLLSAATASDCVPSDNDPEAIYVGLREYLHRRVLNYPQQAHSAYLLLFAGEAQRLLDAAIRHKRLDLLQKVADGYVLTESGLTALDMLAGYAQESGNFTEAAYYLERIAEFFPDSLAAGHLVRMVRCYAALSESERTAEAIARLEKDFAQASVIVAGKSVKALDYARELAGAAVAVSADDGNWLAAGGNDSGQSGAAVLAETGKSVWTQTMDVPNTYSERYLAVQDNVIYINSGRDVAAYSLLDGRGPIWKFSMQSALDGVQEGPAGRVDSDTRRHPWPTAVTIRGHRLYSAIFGVLFCLNVQTGKMLWLADMPGYRGSQAGGEVLHVFTGAPLLSGGNMYTCAVTQDLSADDTYTLYCHDALTGAMKWRQDFCQVNRIGSVVNTAVLAKVATGFAMPAILRQGRGMVYASTNAGAVTAVDSRSGEIAWVTRYDRGPGGDLAGRLEEKWAYCLPVVARGRLFVTPQDSDRMYAFDVRTGEPEWFVERKSADGDYRYLVGVDAASGLVFLGGDMLTAYDMNGKKALAQVKVEGGVIGAGILAGRDMIVPTGAGLLCVDIDGSVADGALKTASAGAWGAMLPGGAKFFEEAGRCSLSLVSGVMLVESGKNLAAVYDLQKRQEIIQQQIAAAGTDRDILRLRLAEVLKADGKADEAIGEFNLALKGLRAQADKIEHFDEQAYFAYKGASPSTLQYYGEKILRTREGLTDTAYRAALRMLGQSPEKVNYGKLYRGEIPPAQDARILNYLKQASEYATTTQAYVDAQLALLARGKAKEDWQGCVDLLVDMSSRPNDEYYDFSRYAAESVVTEAALFAAQEIDELLQQPGGGALYNKYDRAAQALWDKAAASGRAADYYEVALRYPNSLRAREALLQAMELARVAGNERDMVCFAQELLWRYREFAWRYSQDAASAISAMAYMAEGYAALGMRGEAGRTLADMRTTAKTENITQVVLGGTTYGLAQFAADVESLLAKTPRSDRPLLGKGVLTVRRPIFGISDRYTGEHVLLVPEGCAPEGMEGRVFVLQSTGVADSAVISCMDSETLALIWRTALPLGMGLPPELSDYRAGYSGNNLVLAHCNGVMGLDATNGSIHWKRYFSLKLPEGFNLGAAEDPLSRNKKDMNVRVGLNTIIADNAVYVNEPSHPTVLYALNSRTGGVLWNANLGNAVLSGMTLNGEGLYVPVFREKEKAALVAVRRNDGAVIWRSNDLAMAVSVDQQRGEGGNPFASLVRMRFGKYDIPIEICDAGAAGVLVLCGEGLQLYKADKNPVWTNANVGRVDNAHLGDGVNMPSGPSAQHRLAAGEGWCAVAAEAYSQIKVYDLASGKLLQNLGAPQGWWISDWATDGERLHIFSYALDMDGEAVASARCFEARSGRMLYENIFQTGQFQYRPLVTAGHIVFIRGDAHGKSDSMARVYIYDKITGKIAANPVEISEMECEQTGQAIDTRGCILVKGRSKIVSLRITPKGE